MWNDLNFLDNLLSGLISRIYRLELFLQLALMLYAVIFTPSISTTKIFGPISELSYCILTFMSWSIEFGALSRLRTTDIQELMGLYYTVTAFNRYILFVLFYNLWIFQGALFICGLWILEKVDHPSKFVYLISVFNCIKVVLYFVYFLIWCWLYLSRLIPCCHVFARHIYIFFRVRPIKKFCDRHVTQSYDRSDICPICLKPLPVHKVMKLPSCTHVFHKDCIQAWLQIKMQCPMCKMRVMVYQNGEETPLIGV